MNFLGHAFLSFEDDGILTGNMLGDFVKGRNALAAFPETVKQGILLHRKIDEFADHHPAAIKARNIFRPDYRLYSGAFVDALMDHFLANDPLYFGDEKTLLNFTLSVYRRMDPFKGFYPEAFASMFPYLRDQNWLYHYRTFRGLKQAFGGIVRRSQYLVEYEKAFTTTVQYYYELNQLYYDFMDDMLKFAKNELKIYNPGRSM
jgi:acyl carrier protein phosphodiesterase